MLLEDPTVANVIVTVYDLKLCKRSLTLAFDVFLPNSSYLIADPTDEEEELATGVVTVVTLEDDQLCSVNKPG